GGGAVVAGEQGSGMAEEGREEVERIVEEVGEDADLPEQEDRDQGADHSDADRQEADPEESCVGGEVTFRMHRRRPRLLAGMGRHHRVPPPSYPPGPISAGCGLLARCPSPVTLDS